MRRKITIRQYVPDTASDCGFSKGETLTVNYNWKSSGSRMPQPTVDLLETSAFDQISNAIDEGLREGILQETIYCAQAEEHFDYTGSWRVARS